MNTMKAFTDLEQSKKLAKILSIESADMYYTVCADEEDNAHDRYDDVRLRIENPFGDDELKKWYSCYEEIDWYDSPYIPCWSLAALLNMLPETIEDEWGEYDLEIDMIYKKPEYLRLGDCRHSDFPSWDLDNEELLDNIVEAVIWLNNNDYLCERK